MVMKGNIPRTVRPVAFTDVVLYIQYVLCIGNRESGIVCM
jgi:hypothetical protein